MRGGVHAKGHVRRVPSSDGILFDMDSGLTFTVFVNQRRAKALGKARGARALGGGIVEQSSGQPTL